jgi:hypothetical protein
MFLIMILSTYYIIIATGACCVTTHLNLASIFRMSGAVLLSPLYAFVDWTGI